MKIERIQLKFHRDRPSSCHHFKSDVSLELDTIDSQSKFLKYLEEYCTENNFKILSINDVISRGNRYSVANIIKVN